MAAEEIYGSTFDDLLLTRAKELAAAGRALSKRTKDAFEEGLATSNTSVKRQ